MKRLIVVVSAMGKTTDELLKQVEKITDNPDVRELDTLLAIGEQNTISLMAITLNELGVRARSLTGNTGRNQDLWPAYKEQDSRY